MPRRAIALRLDDITEAIARLHGVIGGMTQQNFETDWQTQWLVQRGIEIISEASRHLPDDIKERHPEIPWRQVAGIGNVLRHGYEMIEAALLWRLVRDNLPDLALVCRGERASFS